MIGQMMYDTCLYVFISMNEDDRKGRLFLSGIKKSGNNTVFPDSDITQDQYADPSLPVTIRQT